MNVADVLRECGIVPTAPTLPTMAGTPQTLAASHFPTVPIAPAEKYRVRAQPLQAAPPTSAGTQRLRSVLLALADSVGVERAMVERLTTGELAACKGLTVGTLRSYLLALADTATRQAGKVPAGDTAAIHCAHCGPVYAHPSVAAVLPVVDGWSRALGCPWCFVRKAGGYIPRPRAACDTCARFHPDTVNPVAGMGTCVSGHGMHYPMQQHGCGDYRPKGTDHD